MLIPPKRNINGESIDVQLAACQRKMWRHQRAQTTIENQMQALSRSWHKHEEAIEDLQGIYYMLQVQLEHGEKS